MTARAILKWFIAGQRADRPNNGGFSLAFFFSGLASSFEDRCKTDAYKKELDEAPVATPWIFLLLGARLLCYNVLFYGPVIRQQL